MPSTMASAPSSSGAVEAPVHTPILNLLAVQVGVENALGQRGRQFLGVAGAGETAHAHIGAGRDEEGGLGGRHDFAAQVGVEDAVGTVHGRKLRVRLLIDSRLRGWLDAKPCTGPVQPAATTSPEKEPARGGLKSGSSACSPGRETTVASAKFVRRTRTFKAMRKKN